MKKLRVLYSVLFTILLGTALFSCTNNAGGGLPNIDPEDKEAKSDPVNGGNGGGSGTKVSLTAEQVKAFQTLLNNATDGDIIKLKDGKVPAGSSITISKALTVDGSGVEGLTVKIDPTVLKDINIKNFKKVKIEMGKKSGGRETLVSDNQTENGSFKKFGDGALPLKIEGCTVEDLNVASDVALYLGTGNEKTTIEKINLAEGVEDFTFVEDDVDVADSEKSSVGKLYVENGVREINLIGGSFSDVNFADNFAAKVDFNYDTETEQFKNKAFLNKGTVDKKDISIVESEVSSSNTGVYKFEMSKADFEYFNKYMSVILLTDEQVKALQSGGTGADAAWWKAVDFDAPVYDMSVMGTFAAATEEESELQDGLYPVYGTADFYLDWSTALLTNTKIVDEIFLSKYVNYNKDSLIVEIAGDKATVYVDTAAIKKNDLFMCACPGYDPTLEYQEAIYECGSKLSKINVENYKPYFVFHKIIYYDLGSSVDFEYFNDFEGYKDFIKGKFDSKPIFGEFFKIPCTNNQKFEREYLAYSMEPTAKYPDVSSVEYLDIAIPGRDENSLEVWYYDTNLNFVKKANALLMNLYQPGEKYEYYVDKDFSRPIGFEGPEVENLNILYARPKRNIIVYTLGCLFGYEEVKIYKDDPIVNITSFNGTCSNIHGHRICTYKDYDEAKDTYSNIITSIKDIKDGDTVYVIPDYVTLYIIDPDSPDATPIFLCKKNIRDFDEEWGSDVAYYTSPDMKNSTNIEELYQQQQCGKKIYYNQEMVVKQLDPDYPPELGMYCDSEKVGYFKFKKRVSAGEKYYFSSDSDTPITVADLEKLLTDKAFDCVPYPVYKKGIVVTEIKSADDISSKNVAVAAILNIFDEGFYHFYSDLEMTKELSREDVAKLGAGDNVYIHSNVLQVKCMSANHEGCINIVGEYFDEQLYYSYNISIYDLVNKNKMIEHKLEFYKEESLTTKYTEEELKKLAEGTQIYAKETCVQPYPIYYNDSKDPAYYVCVTDDCNYPTIDDLIMWRTISGDIRCFTDKEKKNEISKDEIGTLPECSPVYVYERKVWVQNYKDANDIDLYNVDDIVNNGFLEMYSYFKDPELKEILTAEEIRNLIPGTKIYSSPKIEDGWLVYLEGEEVPRYLTPSDWLTLFNYFLDESYEVYSDEARTTLYEFEPRYQDDYCENLDFNYTPPKGTRFYIKEK